MKHILDSKIRSAFPAESVFKTPDRYSVFSGKILPSFIKDWLIAKYSDSYGNLDTQSISDFLKEHIPDKNSNIKSRLRVNKEELVLLSRLLIETDIKNNLLRFAIPDMGIKITEGLIPDYLAKKHSELKDGEVWGVITIIYKPPIDKVQGHIELIDFKAFNPYDVDVDYFIEARKEFSISEWVDLIIRSMEYNPDYINPDDLSQSFTFARKLLFLSRLIMHVEPNINMIELAPKGTGKSYVFGNLSKYGWLVSGGVVSRAKLLYDMQRKTPGLLKLYDFVALDEIETIKFTDENEIQGALKNYLESGTYTVGDYRGVSNSGLILLGNIQLNEYYRPMNNSYFSGLPMIFKSSALLDRFHGFIEGWDLVRITEDIKVRGQTLNVEYFSEILHKLREIGDYTMIVDEMLDIPKNADTRDVKAVIKLTTAYLKLLFPHVKSKEDVSKEDFHKYCLTPAIYKRSVIRKQLSMIDPEYKEQMPIISIK
ncbi:MAG: BREX system Lon protease-like protein BrxL [Candidatus Cloacimonas sp.]